MIDGWTHEALRQARQIVDEPFVNPAISSQYHQLMRLDRERRIDHAVRQVFGLYESERAYGIEQMKIFAGMLERVTTNRPFKATQGEMQLLHRRLDEFRVAYHRGS